MWNRLSFGTGFPIAAIFSLCFILTSCDNSSDDMFDCDGITPTYTADVKPILDASCAKSGCHDAFTVQNGVNLSNYSTASAISQEERFLGVIHHREGFPPMPFDGPKLPQAQLQILSCWVQNGSPQ